MSNYQSVDFERMAEIFRALGNPHRLRILAQLADCCRPGSACCTPSGELSVGEIGDGLEIVASTLSHHVKELNRAGLLGCNRQGKCVMCCIDREALRALGAFFSELAGEVPLRGKLSRSAIINARSKS